MTRVRVLWMAFLVGTLIAAGCELLQDDPPPTDDAVDETATLNVTVQGEGNVSSDPAGIDCPGECEADFEINSVVQLTASPDAEWELETWEGACDGPAPTCEVQVQEDATVTAVFGEAEPDATVTIEAAIVDLADDAQEFEDFVNPSYPDGATWIYNHENNLAYDNHWDTNVLTGLRFVELDIPQGATIASAYVQFTASSPRSTGMTQAEGSNSTATSLVVHGEAADHASAFVDQEVHNISNRTLTSSSVEWDDVPEWVTDAAGPDQRTPNLSDIVQGIVDRPGWDTGNAIALIFSGDGQRVAYAYREAPDDVPVLTIEYETP